MKYSIEIVRWLDSVGSSGWNHVYKLDNHPMQCVSSGFVIFEDEQAITLSASLGDENGPNEQADSAITIPKSCITSRKILKKSKLNA